tara:strand:- start:1031 stop:1858 length:828 start_codon:yes stop_codon:yes gene_type:complete
LCKPKIENFSKEDMINYYIEDFPELSNIKIKRVSKKLPILPHNTTFLPQNNTILTNSEMKEFRCEFCNKIYSRKDSLYRHQKKSCKSKIEKKDLYDKIETLINEITLIKEENKKLKEELIVTKYESNTMINSNNTIKNNKIQINNYGSENIEYITDKVFMKLLSTPLAAIPKLIELKHFNPKHPENHNIKITNIHDKFAKIYKDNKWLISHKKDVITDLVDNGYADFEEFKDLNEEELTAKIKEKYKIMEQYFIKNPDKLCKKSEVMIINGSNKN